MKKIYSIAILLITIISSCKTTSNIPDTVPYTNHQDINYGTDDNHKIDISLPMISSEKTNVILYIHGGSLIRGDKGEIYTFLDMYRKNCIVASMNYRFVNSDIHVLDIVKDVDLAVNFVKAFAEENGISINRLILMGHSAGAHLGLLYSYMYCETSIIPIGFCISSAGPTDFGDIAYWYNFKKSNQLNQRLSLPNLYTDYAQKVTVGDVGTFGMNGVLLEKMMEISPITYISEKVPPTILIHDVSDMTVPFSNATSLATALHLLKVPYRFIQLQSDIGHGLGNIPQNGRCTYPQYLQERLIQNINEYITEYCE